MHIHICIGKYSNIFEYPNIRHTAIVWRIWNFDTNEYPNIFILKKTIRTNVWIYLYQKKDTNMIRTNICGRKYSNIFEYPNIRHTMFSTSKYFKDSDFHSHLVFSELKNCEVFNEVDVFKLVHRVNLLYQRTRQVQDLNCQNY